ncbi:MAG: hypothetical protein EBU72_13005, partial [Betaproteobacteria bacterium]|nr:hypothetical protein [Betaproteobacteria bacterium]
LVSGSTYNLTGTLSAALSAGQTVRVSYDGGTTWSTLVTPEVNGTTLNMTGKTLGASGQVLAKVVDAQGKFGLGFNKDFIAPSVSSVTDDVIGTANASTTNVTYAYTFSESVTGLSTSSFTPTNGTVTSVSGSGKNWTVNVSPNSGIASGTIGLTLNAGAVTDAAGNANASSTQNSQAIDTVSPTLQSTQLAGNLMTLTFSESLDSGHLPSATQFSVQLNGTSVAVNSLSVNGNQLILTLASSVTASSGSVTYTDPTSGDDLTAVQDTSGNDASGFTSGFGSSTPSGSASPLELKWVSTTGTGATTSTFEVWTKAGYKVGSADLGFSLDPTKASFAVVDGSSPSTSDFIIANNAGNPTMVAYISLNAPSGPVKLFSFNTSTLTSSGTVYDLSMQNLSMGFEDGAHTNGSQTPAIGRFIVGGTGSDVLNLSLITSGTGPEPTTLIGGTASDTGVDVAKIDIAAVAASFTGALTVAVDSSTVWHIKDSSATPKLIADVLVKSVAPGSAYDLVFHKPGSTDTVTESLINVEQLKFFNGNTFIGGWKLSDHSVLTA